MAGVMIRETSDPRVNFKNGSEVWSLSGGIVQLSDDIEPGKWASRFLIRRFPEVVKVLPIDDPQQPACLAIKQCMQGKPGFLGSGYHSAALKETVQCGCRYCGALCEITSESIERDIRIGYWKNTLSVTFDALEGDGTSTETVRTKLYTLDAQHMKILFFLFGQTFQAIPHRDRALLVLNVTQTSRPHQAT
ncbi:hypothetical protein J4E83_008847 [Alternaria metachromatica]|uniref:uncharacterized protein n=1 Tax=Alternaria metachromatica TaxID=283354 RepID=UPI0020C53829|nr:uncharacterized protein J4E83_008847 [Alternaria metachromatica]KAI4609205.1 hypothetical protein J4E83_008847 [Alternaria metachromatica]